MQQPISFNGKNVLITGGAGGIAEQTARLFLSLEASVFLTDLHEAALQEQALRLEGGPRVAFAAADVRDSAAVDAVVAQCVARLGALDHLVNCAGLYPARMVGDMSDEDWRQVMQVNLDGTFHACRAAARFLPDGGSIVNLTSVAGHRGSFSHAHYSAAKSGVLGLSRSLALELAPRVRVNCVSPGPVDTPMIRQTWDTDAEKLLAATPLHRLCQPGEVARAIVFLCSDWASFITAETLQVNGGLYIA